MQSCVWFHSTGSYRIPKISVTEYDLGGTEETSDYTVYNLKLYCNRNLWPQLKISIIFCVKQLADGLQILISCVLSKGSTSECLLQKKREDRDKSKIRTMFV